METRRLGAFIRIVETGSLTRASQLLNIAQPALSQQLAALEAELGAQLLVRSRQGVAATPAGRALYRHAQIILKLLDEARREVKRSHAELEGLVAIGLPLAAAAVLSVPLLRAARARHPGVSLELVDGLPGNLLNELAMNGRVDICLLPGNVSANGVRTKQLLMERLALVASAESPLTAQDGPVRVRDLKGHPLVLPSKTNRVRQAVDAGFAAADLQPNVVAEMNSVYSLCAAAAANVGSTIVPHAGAKLAAPGLLIREIVEPEIKRPIHIAVSDALPLSAPAQAIYDLILHVVPELVAAGEWPGARLTADAAA